MKPLDRLLQRWRWARARRYLSAAEHLLDVGCADGEPLLRLPKRLRSVVGIDPTAPPRDDGRVRLVQGNFPTDLPAGERFDAITVLAVLEHVPTDLQPAFVGACFDRLLPGGRLVISVPEAAVDTVLAALMRLRILDGMHAEQHYGFSPRDTVPLCNAAGFVRVAHDRFQLGLNNLFVFERPATPAAADRPSTGNHRTAVGEGRQTAADCYTRDMPPPTSVLSSPRARVRLRRAHDPR